jgi:hypothetical protein
MHDCVIPGTAAVIRGEMVADLGGRRSMADRSAVAKTLLLNLQIQERAQDAAHGSQFSGRDCAETAVKALICHRPRVFGPGE